jgi:uncharacterized membrane protein YdbT with pleckstrin-like domain
MPVVYNSSKAKPKEKPDEPVTQKKVVKKKSPRPLAAFITRPKGIRFENQEKGEEIILLLRRHWITNLPWLLIVILMSLAPILLKFFPFLDFLPLRFRLISVTVWYMLTLAFVFEQFLSWFFNVNIVTDERIVDIDFYSLIYKEISHCKIDRIQDVTYKMGGVIRTLFNYGDVLIQTAGERPVFEFSAVPKPTIVVRKINDLIVEEEQEQLEGRLR